MTSNDVNNNNNFITAEMFNARMDRLEAVINGKFTEVKSEIRIVNNRIDNMAERIEDLKFFGTVGFAMIAIFIAIVALVPIFRRERSERNEELSPRNIRDIRALIREEIALSNRIKN